MKLVYTLGGLILFTVLLSSKYSSKRVIDEQLRLGSEKPVHYIEKLDEAKIKQGEALIKKGWAYKTNGNKSKLISKHFVCTSCHNIKQVDPILNNTKPQDRLKYAEEHNLPFLQGTTLYGTVNRKHWYNGDYSLKYGSLVIPAADTLENAVQLCAEVCSQGRVLDDWELESIMHYLWTIDLKTDDLPTDKYNTAEELSALFEDASPATFVEESKSEMEGVTGNSENGKLIFERGCMFCHNGKEQVSSLKLKKDKYTLNKFKRNLYNGSDFDLLHIARKGTKPHVSHKPYMPHYTAERLSKQQLADLIAFVKQ